MSLKDDFSVLDPASEVQSAYDNSARTIFEESALNPWTISRHSVAIALGCELIKAVGPCVSEFRKNGAHDNVLRDVVIVLYLSSLDDDAVMDLDESLNIKATMIKAYEWAERHGVEYGSSAFIAGVSILDKILKRILVSFFEVESSGGESSKKKIPSILANPTRRTS